MYELGANLGVVDSSRILLLFLGEELQVDGLELCIKIDICSV